MTDDFRFDITSDRGIEKALAVAFIDYSKVYAWAEGTTGEGVTKLFFSWTDNPQPFSSWGDQATPGWGKLLAPLDVDTIGPMVILWLRNHPAPKVETYADSVGQGWRIRNTDRHGNWSVLFSVEPYLCEYSK